MINHEKDIFNQIAERLRKKYDDIYIIGEQISNIPPRFPAVSIIEENSVVNRRYSTFEKLENVATSTLYIEIYSNSENKKDECLNIACEIDEVLCMNDYYRKLNRPMVNADNAFARRVMRYTRDNLI